MIIYVSMIQFNNLPSEFEKNFFFNIGSIPTNMYYK